MGGKPELQMPVGVRAGRECEGRAALGRKQLMLESVDLSKPIETQVGAVWGRTLTVGSCPST